MKTGSDVDTALEEAFECVPDNEEDLNVITEHTNLLKNWNLRGNTSV